MKRMLFNATHVEELRVAIVEGQKLIDLDLESTTRTEKKGNIYKGVVTKVEPSLEACFVDYGTERQGFLPFKEIYRDYFSHYDPKTAIADIKIDDVIKKNLEIIVQVGKDERGTKGAALTTFISLAGRFLVLMPNNPKGGGISRRIAGGDRADLREMLSHLELKSKHSLIARTEGIGRSKEELQWDLDFLTKVWDTIELASNGPRAPFLIYQESNLLVRSIRDHLSDDITEIVVDDEEVFDRAHRFISQVMPQKLKKLKIYKDPVPLFTRYQIEGQIDAAFNREVNLPSGGSLAIDHTEALISIDVNSARATKGSDIEETALQTNLEAVEEIAMQLRIRDLGGLVVIDLIDMADSKNQRAVESKLKDALQADRARVQIGHISKFGLLEMSRQRLRSSLSDMNYRICPRCEGMGNIRSVVSSSLNLLRMIEDEALKENTEAIQLSLPLDMATYLFNEKRHELHILESRLASKIIIIPSNELVSPHFQLKRLRSDELDEIAGTASFQQKMEISQREPGIADSLKIATPERPHVQVDQIGHTAPPPESTQARGSTKRMKKGGKPGLFSRLIKSVFPKDDAKEKPVRNTQAEKKPAHQGRGHSYRTGQDNRNHRQSQGNRNSRKDASTKQSESTQSVQKPVQESRQQDSRQGDSHPGISHRGAQNQTRGQGDNRPRRQNTHSSSDPQPFEKTQDGWKTSTTDTHKSATRGQKPQRRGQGYLGRNPRSNKPSKQTPHPGPIVSVENIPADLPDDIGNRK